MFVCLHAFSSENSSVARLENSVIICSGDMPLAYVRAAVNCALEQTPASQDTLKSSLRRWL